MAQFCMQDRLSYAGNLYCSLANVLLYDDSAY